MPMPAGTAGRGRRRRRRRLMTTTADGAATMLVCAWNVGGLTMVPAGVPGATWARTARPAA